MDQVNTEGSLSKASITRRAFSEGVIFDPLSLIMNRKKKTLVRIINGVLYASILSLWALPDNVNHMDDPKVIRS